jgi:hypothetical protein
MRPARSRFALALAALTFFASMPGADAATYTLTRTAIAGGGLSPSGTGPYTLSATLAQGSAGRASGGPYTLSAGFLYPRDLATTDAPPTPAIPTRVEFLPTSPNPARHSTRLSFELPAPAVVRLDVISVEGRRVATLLSRRFDAGRHQLHWNLADEAGHPLPPGLYFAVLSVGASRRSQRLVVLDR